MFTANCDLEPIVKPIQPQQNPIVMISHTETELYLAEAWKELVCAVFGLAEESVWFSSAPAAIGARHRFAEYIEESIQTAQAIISIQSPFSRIRPWILWEAGMARGLSKSVYVIVYEPLKTAKRESIVGNLGTPLDAFQHYRGTDLKHVKDSVLRLLQDDISRPMNVTKLDDALRKYKEAVEPWENRWVRREITFDNRIRLVLQSEERQRLAEVGVISDTVEVVGDRDSMIIFDLREARIAWGDFINHLKGLTLPWPGSASRWASGLGSSLQRALKGQCLEGPEGLPLYFDARKNYSYRPSILSCEDNGGETSFHISFTHLPKELIAGPKTKVGVLLHHLDFCRMMRWGLLEDSRFAAFFRNIEPVNRFAPFLRNPQRVRRENRAELIRDFLERMFSIRTEFWNRGVERDSISDAVGEEDKATVKSVFERYYAIIGKLDPEDKGILPNPLPEFGVLRQTYSDLLKLNKEFYILVHKALGRELAELADETDEIRIL